MSATDLLDFSPEVAEARSAKKPIVALELTIITHGMPYPRNVETALAVENAAREMGAVPATIAVIEGRFRVGLSRRGDRPTWAAHGRRRQGLSARSGPGRGSQRLRWHDGRSDNVHCRARKHRNLRYRRHRRRAPWGRGDLRHLGRSGELSRTRVAVVCAGAKSILDIGKTLEFLENMERGRRLPRREFPAFYARSSGFKLEHRCDGLHDLARMIRLQREIGPGGLLIANPIPSGSRARTGRHRRAHRRGRRRSQGARRGQEGGDAVLAQARGRTLRRTKPRGQCRADQEQRHARRAGGGGAHEIINARPNRRPGPNDVRARSSSARRLFSGPLSDENRAPQACRRSRPSQRMLAKAKATSAPTVTSIS